MSVLPKPLTVPTFHSLINCPFGTGTLVTETTGTEAEQGCLHTYAITVLETMGLWESHALFVSLALLVFRTDGKTKEAKVVQSLQE